MKITEVEFGTEVHFQSSFIFFGNRNSQIENLKKSYPQFLFSRIHQIHGNKVVHRTSENYLDLIEADGHWTEELNTALCISTADCVPIFAFDAEKGIVAGIHAGWRGVQSRILPNTLETLKIKNSDMSRLRLFIGPHIQMKSFEVDLDVKNNLLSSAMIKNENFSEEISDKKFLVDLNAIVKSQAQEYGINPDQIFDLKKDTKSDLKFHSHRRDKEKSGRQISFILFRN